MLYNDLQPELEMYELLGCFGLGNFFWRSKSVFRMHSLNTEQEVT